jgi:hypothetical protein
LKTKSWLCQTVLKLENRVFASDWFPVGPVSKSIEHLSASTWVCLKIGVPRKSMEKLCLELGKQWELGVPYFKTYPELKSQTMLP